MASYNKKKLNINLKVKVNPIWYVLPIIEVIGFFMPYVWTFLIVFAASIASIAGFFFIRKKSMPMALVNLVVGAIVLLVIILGLLFPAAPTI